MLLLSTTSPNYVWIGSDFDFANDDIKREKMNDDDDDNTRPNEDNVRLWLQRVIINSKEFNYNNLDIDHIFDKVEINL